MDIRGSFQKYVFLASVLCSVSGPAFAQRAVTNGGACVTGDGVFWDQSYVCDSSQVWRHPAFQFGTNGASCAAGVAGMVQWTGTALQYCDGTNWDTLGGAASSTITLGTSVSAANPQISGDATSGFYTSAASTVAVGAGGKEVMQWNTLASAVDYLSITPAIASGAPIIGVAGSTNESLNLTPAGTGAVNITTANTGLQIAATNAIRFPTSDSNGASGSIAIGSSALSGQTSSAAYGSTAIGYQAMRGTMTTAATQNTAVGYAALTADTSGANNTAVGYAALYSNGSGGGNVAVGGTALFNTTGSGNSALGYYALAGNTTGSSNSGFGYYALEAATGSSNSGFGYYALETATGSNNSGFGVYSGYSITSGASNTVLGYDVASATLTTGSNNILIGTDASTTTPLAATSNWLNIGNVIYGYNLKNSTNTTGKPQIAIGSGLTSVTAGAVLDLSSNTTSATSSLLLPVGTTAARPTTGVNGMIRYNSTAKTMEGFVSGAWTSFTTTATAGTIALGTSLTANNPQISGDATTGFYTPAASTVAMTTAGTERMRVDGSGNVDIGTTAAQPDYKVTENGGIYASSSTSANNGDSAVYGYYTGTAYVSAGVSGINTTTNSGYGVYGLISSSGSVGVYGDTTGAGQYGVMGHTSNTAYNSTGVQGTADAASGNTIGVGGTSESPDGTGVVAFDQNDGTALVASTNASPGAAIEADNADPAVTTATVNNYDTTSGGNGDALDASTSSGTGSALYGGTGSTTGYGGYFEATAASGTDYGVFTTTDGNASGYGLYSETGLNYFGGAVGIGTETPNAQLQVYDPNNPTVNSTIATLSKNLSTPNDGGSLDFAFNWGGGSWYTPARIMGLDAYGYGGQLAFYTKVADSNPSGSSLERMRIDNNGNVGIGTTTPQAILDINGYMRLAKNTVQPAACSSTNDGAIALTHVYTLCACDGGTTTWVKTSDGATACSW